MEKFRITVREFDLMLHIFHITYKTEIKYITFKSFSIFFPAVCAPMMEKNDKML